MIYLASPYSHDWHTVRRERFEQAASAAGKLMSQGHHMFSPITHTHPIAVAGGLPLGYDFWEQYDRWFIERCDEVVVLKLDGWEESKGIARELEYAKQLGKPIRYMECE